jgi:hypothetical protein
MFRGMQRHDFFVSSMLLGMFRGTQHTYLMLIVRFQAYEIGLVAACSGIAAATSDHDAIATIVAEKLQPIQKQLSEMKEQTSALMAMIENQKREAQNGRASADDGLLLLLRKTRSGHPSREPNDPKLQELQRPVQVGKSPPSLLFFPKKGLTTSNINKLTDAQINDLEWYYNEKFSGGLCRDHIFRRGYFEMFAAQHGHSKYDELFFRRRPLPLAQAISPRVCVSKDDQKLLVHGLIHVVVLL